MVWWVALGESCARTGGGVAGVKSFKELSIPGVAIAELEGTDG